MPAPTFTHNELESLWIQAGGSQAQADVAASIAQAESGGCMYALAGPTDIRPLKTCTFRQTTQENSMGLWQVNRNAHPQYAADYLFTPQGNAAAAVAISSGGTSFGPWSTFTNGAYKSFLTGKVSPVVVPATFGVSPSGAVLQGGPNPLGGSQSVTTPAAPGGTPAGPQGPVGGTEDGSIPQGIIDGMETFRNGLGQTIPYYLTRAQNARAMIRRHTHGR